MRLRLALVFLTLGSIPVGPASAVTRTQEPVEAFDDAIEVRVVTTEVVVTDEDGTRVSGLPRDAFRVVVDGKEVPIAYFSEIGPDALAGGSPGGGEGAAAQQTPGVNFLVFIDDVLTLVRNRDFVLEALREQLAFLGPRDRMAIVAYDGTELAVLADWTSSRSALEQAVDRAIARPGEGIKWIALRRMEDYIANWEGRATRRSVLAAAASLSTLDVPSGRKALLLVAGSWDPLEVRTASNFRDWCYSGTCEGGGVFAALTDAANLLNYSIYSIDVEGRDPNSNWPREKRIQNALRVLAKETGGQTLLNAKRRAALEVASSDTRSYYSLGFVAPEARRDRRSRIRVQVERPGLKVRSRASFVTVSPERSEELEMLQAMLLGSGRRSPDFPVRVGPAEPVSTWKMEAEVSVSVPLHDLTWLPDDDGWVARFEIQLAALDVHGRASDVARHPMVVRREEIPSVETFLGYPFTVTMRKRQQSLAVYVRDQIGGDVHSGVVSVAPPRAQQLSAGATSSQ